MRVIIYDMEVFAHDWLLVGWDVDAGAFLSIHNEPQAVAGLLRDPEVVLGGFNNKHYDDWILRVILGGGSRSDVKRCNDFIIGGGNGWDFLADDRSPYRRLRTFDLRDDISDKGLSLKAIEGNLGMGIVESSVPFDIDRPLTEDELAEVERYCRHDVEATVRLYHERSKYLESKMVVGRMYGIPEADALGMTNAKLSARVLGAKMTERGDERDFVPPACIDRSLVPDEVWDFFDRIHDRTIPDEVLWGSKLKVMLVTGGGRCPVTYAWGGVHGAKPAVDLWADDGRLIVNWDVSSLYPSSMINFGLVSRSCADPRAYEAIVDRRLKAKHSGDKATADALKLVINTTYGASLSRFNALSDPRNGRSVCIANQLCMTMLMVMLARRCGSIDFININTDGVMFSIDRSEDSTATEVVDEWCGMTGFEMERDDFARVIQKDVNNYIAITPDGHTKRKGGFTSLYDGGSFKMNSLRAVQVAVVDYLVDGTDPADRLSHMTDVRDFQQIAKTGGTYDATYHEVCGEMVEVQRVNRIYAVSDPNLGRLYKYKLVTERRRKNKETGRMEPVPVDPPAPQQTVFAGCPEHTLIDNEGTATVADLDMSYYVSMAWDRIGRYTKPDPAVVREIERIEKEITIMATTDTNTNKNVYQRLSEARRLFAEAGVKKNGKNLYAEYKYFTLDDIIPVKQRVFEQVGLCDCVSFDPEEAVLVLYNTDDPQDFMSFTTPMAEDESLIKNPIQKLGAVQTYIRRYLYVALLDICEPDLVEEVAGMTVEQAPKAVRAAVAASEGRKTAKASESRKAPATTKERAEIASKLTDGEAPANKTQVAAIKSGLKKLRDSQKDGEQEGYITKVVHMLKAGITKEQGDALLAEIGLLVG